MAKQVLEQKILYIHSHKAQMNQMIKCIKCFPKQNSTLFYKEGYKIQILTMFIIPIISYTFLDMWIGKSLYPTTRRKSHAVEWKPVNGRHYTVRRYWLRNSYITCTNMCVCVCVCVYIYMVSPYVLTIYKSYEDYKKELNWNSMSGKHKIWNRTSLYCLKIIRHYKKLSN